MTFFVAPTERTQVSIAKDVPLTDVFERFLKFCERCQAGFDDAVGPLADLGMRVAGAPDG